MNDARLEKVEEIFSLVADLSSDARAARLEAECAGDAWLLAEVAKRLRAHDAAPPDASRASTLSVGTIGRLQFLRPLGRGAFGEVWLAREVDLERFIAVKVLSSSAGRANHALDEARLAKDFQHANVAHVYYVGSLSENGSPYIAMELCHDPPLDPGSPMESLSSQLTATLSGKDGGVVAAASNMAAAARGVEAGHRVGVIHGDIKPGNILRSPRGVVKVTDFGLGRAGADPVSDLRPAFDASVNVEVAPGRRVAGTPPYMAPELARAGIGTLRTDVYALGATLYHLLSGHAPYAPLRRDELPPHLDVIEQVSKAAAPPDLRRRGVPKGLRKICLRAMATDPSRRYRDADEFASALERWETRRKLLGVGKAVGFASIVVGALSLVVLAAVQWNARHVSFAGGVSEAAILERGFPSGHFPLPRLVDCDLGMAESEFRPASREAARRLLLWGSDGPDSAGFRELLGFLLPQAQLRWRGAVGDWAGAVDLVEASWLEQLPEAEIQPVRNAWEKLIPHAPTGAATAITPLLRHASAGVRDRAVESLGKIPGNVPDEALSELIHLAERDPDDGVQISAIQALGEIARVRSNPKIVSLLCGLIDGPTPINLRSAAALRGIGELRPDEVKRGLRPWLDGENLDAQDLAFLALEEIGPDASQDLIADLLGRLKARDAARKLPVIDLLGKIGEAKRDLVVETLRPLIESPDAQTRVGTLRAIGGLGSNAVAACESEIARAAKDESDEVATAAVDAATAGGRLVNAAVVEEVANWLKPGSDRLRQSKAAWAARFIKGSDSLRFAPLLIYLLRFDGADSPFYSADNVRAHRSILRNDAAESLGLLANKRPEVILTLIDSQLRSDDQKVREGAVHALQFVNREHLVRFIDYLCTHVADSSEFYKVRLECVGALGHVEAAALKRAGESLSSLVTAGDERLALEAGITLGGLGKAAYDAFGPRAVPY